jgi:hypothetical protein
LSGTLNNLENKYDFGVLFEFLYGKLVAMQLCGIVFTDQVNTGNCGYKNVNYCRHYNVTYNTKIKTETIDVFVDSEILVKIFDFDNYKVQKYSRNIFGSLDDLLPEGGGIINGNNEINETLVDCVYNSSMCDKVSNFVNMCYKKNEIKEIITTLTDFRKAFSSLDRSQKDSQVSKFVEIFKKNIPEKYTKRPINKEIIKYTFVIEQK